MSNNKKRQPTPVFLPGELHGQRSLADYSPWGCKELDMTEQLSLTHSNLLPRACLVAQEKNLSVQEMWVQSLDWEDPLEKGMTTHSSILAWRITWTEKSGRLQSMRSQRVGHD